MADDGVYFGPGTTPRRVAEAVERAKDQRRDEGGRKAPSTTERERFFGSLAELGKRVGR